MSKTKKRDSRKRLEGKRKNSRVHGKGKTYLTLSALMPICFLPSIPGKYSNHHAIPTLISVHKILVSSGKAQVQHKLKNQPTMLTKSHLSDETKQNQKSNSTSDRVSRKCIICELFAQQLHGHFQALKPKFRILLSTSSSSNRVHDIF